jgi:hypothetical protein
MELNNPDYDMKFIMQKIADESPTFKKELGWLLRDTDSEFPTNELWLGTLENKQIKLVITQESKNFIDEG